MPVEGGGSVKERTGHRIVRNALFGVASQALGGGLFFISAILVARHLGPENYGPFSFIFAFVAVIHMVADFGLTQILVREISRNKDKLDKILGAVVPLVTLLAVAGTVIVVISAQLLPLTTAGVNTMYIMGASVLLTFHAAVYGAVCRAYEQMGFNAAVLVLQRILLFICVLLALYYDAGLAGVAMCYLGERLFQWLFLRILIRIKYSRYRWSIDMAYWRYLLVEGLPLGAGMVLRRISWYLDIFILTALSTASAVGLFSAAFRVIQLINVIPFTLSIPVFPVFARLAVESRQRVLIIYTKVLRIFILIGLPIAVWVLMLGSQTAVILFGEEYRSAGEALMIMGPMVVFLFLNSLYVHIFSALDSQARFLRAVSVAVVVNVALDFLLIPAWGINGAAFATLVSEIVLYLTGAVMLSRLGHEIAFLRLFLRPLIALLVPSVALLWAVLTPSLSSFLLASVAFTILYLISGYFLKLVHQDDINIILDVLRRKSTSAVTVS